MRKTFASVVARLYQVAGTSSVDHVELVFFGNPKTAAQKALAAS
jgi:protein-disulfide isomerase